MNEPIKIPETSPHGLLITELGRHPNQFRRGGFEGRAIATEELRLTMTARAVIKTERFEGHTEIELTREEVKAFNKIEAQIAKRLSAEILEQQSAR